MSNGIQGKQKKDKFFTIEFFGVTVIITSFLLLVCLLFGESVLFEIGLEIQVFLLGLLGYLSYPFLLVGIFLGFVMLLGKKPTESKYRKPVFYTVALLFLVMCLLTVLTSQKETTDLNSYVNYAFETAKGGVKTAVAGGALISFATYYAVSYLTYVGAIIAISILLLIVLGLASKQKKVIAQENKEIKIAEINAKAQAQAQAQVQAQFNQMAQNAVNSVQQQVQQNLNYNNNPVQNGYNQQNNTPNPYDNSYQRSALYGNQNNQYQGPVFNDRDKYDKSMEILYGKPTTYSQSYNDSFSDNNLRVEPNYNVEPLKVDVNATLSSPIKMEDTVKDFTLDEGFSFNYKPENISQNEDVYSFDGEDIIGEPISDSGVSDFLKNLGAEAGPIADKETNDTQSSNFDGVEVESEPEYAKRLIENMPLNYKYKKPPISIFKTIDNSKNNYEFEVFKAEVKAKILSTLKTFGVDTDIPRVFKGPAVTRFDIAIPADVPMSKVTKLQNDLNLRIAAKSAIRMIAPVPNTSYVGIEVPNNVMDSVSIKDIIVSDEFINTKPFSLTFALGKDVIGTPVSLDIAEMPHLLVTGTTGSGKSVCLNTLITSLITKYGPDELRFVIVDPKRVDLEPFREIPHMMFGEIIEDVPTTNSMLTWAVEEMESRYCELSRERAKNIKDYNTKAREAGKKIMPRIVIVMDEFADIMLQDKKGVATKVCLIAQKARAAGIHLVLAAQRPSVDIIEGPIKSNLPSRIVFRASSMPDSMTSLGEAGAEKLLGRGDCLYKTAGMLNVERVMGAYVSDEEMYAVIDYVSENNEKYFDYNNWAKIVARVNQATSTYSGGESGGDSEQGEDYIDPLYIKAMRIGYNFGGLSASFLQRKLAVGFPKAGKIIDWLTDNGYITPNAVAGKRQMILSKEKFEEKFGAE